MKTRLISFNTGTNGMHDHRLFIESVNKHNVKIIHAYTLFYDYQHSHKPESLNYVIQYKTESKIVRWFKNLLKSFKKP